MRKPINIKRAHIAHGDQVYGQREYDSLTSRSVRIPLTAHAKKRLGIPLDHKAYVMLLIDKTVNNEG